MNGLGLGPNSRYFSTGPLNGNASPSSESSNSYQSRHSTNGYSSYMKSEKRGLSS